MQKQLLLIWALSLWTFTCLAQQVHPVASYRMVEGKSIVQSKNYYLLTLFQEVDEVKELLRKDTQLRKVLEGKQQHLSRSLIECGKEATCFSSGMKFTDSEIKQVSERLSRLYKKDNALGILVSQHLIPSRAYILFEDAVPQDMLVKAWEQDARGINHVIGVYAEGAKPYYPLIDSISYDVSSSTYPRFVYTVTEAVLQESRDANLFFTPSMNYALRFLEVNHRGEAADYEPMPSTVNKAAFDRIKDIDWNAYPYTLILVPGAGPDNPEEALSGIGMLRCRVAAQQYFKGLAPFLVVSGGRVHPHKTRYSEAYEMKMYLMETMGVPEHAIIMEPHARHTTTNMRNTARLIFRYGMPYDKPCITSTSKYQSDRITGSLSARCQKELLHVPFRNGKRLSNTEAEFYPVLDALHINPLEPLDP
ncbi:DUF218 domain-containing protein [Pontibacter mucosus]|uniref:DUF218 domain-containing protein n=1 Tax=Pontibacter mucosus TaxID=1649266 RepID=A0A2T5YG14_9BACT|nr:YdcF family protein [Pontibacter mucosus]PTX18221.1 DUF218 domain-containing protein [Pontibacter mucosus]